MSTPKNYITDLNKFHLAGPPLWFKKALWDFDSSFVIVPSRQGFYYRLAQRRPIRLKESIINDILKEQGDTRMLSSYGLVPVTTILATVDWGNPYLFVELANRAPWRLGGADKVNEMLETQDRQDRMDRNIKNDYMLTDLTKDAWKLYNKKIGLRSSMYSPRTKSNQKAPTGHLIIPNPPSQYKPLVLSTWARS